MDNGERPINYEESYEAPRKRIRLKIGREGVMALLPFIYLGLGFLFGWWIWAWVIIPVGAILMFAARDIGKYTFVALSPFVFFLLGWFFGWWAWAWVIIPVTAILVQFLKIEVEDDEAPKIEIIEIEANEKGAPNEN